MTGQFSQFVRFLQGFDWLTRTQGFFPFEFHDLLQTISDSRKESNVLMISNQGKPLLLKAIATKYVHSIVLVGRKIYYGCHQNIWFFEFLGGMGGCLILRIRRSFIGQLFLERAALQNQRGRADRNCN